MIRVVLLDTGPLGLASDPKSTSEAESCRAWLDHLLAARVNIIVPEIADYEVRRELLRAGKTKGLAQLDALALKYDYLPVTKQTWRQAAQFWAQSRQKGQPTADPKELDGDVILAAQAVTLGLPESEVVVATTNVGHIARFTPAELWQNILSH